MFTEQSTFELTTKENGVIEVRRIDRVLKDGVTIGTPTYHRHVLTPGQDLSNEDPVVSAVANAVWTPEVIENWQAKQANAII